MCTFYIVTAHYTVFMTFSELSADFVVRVVCDDVDECE